MDDHEPGSSDALLERLAALESGQLSDILDEAGLPNQVLSANLVPLVAGQRIAGRAVCARGAPLIAGPSAKPLVPADALDALVGPASVLVIETGGFTAGACVGGLVAYSLKRAGCAGVITDGAVRDAEEINELGLPCIAAARTPLKIGGRWRLCETGKPVVLPGQTGPGVSIAPGDLVLADADGVVVVPSAIALQIIEDAEVLRDIELAIMAQMRGGASRAASSKANPRFDHVRPVPRDAV